MGKNSKNSVSGTLSLLNSSMSLAERLWGFLSFILIGGGGLGAALLAKADPFLKQLGSIYWLGIGLLTSLVFTIIFWLIKSAFLKQAAAETQRILATPRATINPLSESFKDVVIPIEDLRLPAQQLQSQKHFKRCIFVGPGSMAIAGCNITRNKFTDTGDLIRVQSGTMLTGIILFQDCTFEECTFVRITMLMDEITADAFAQSSGITLRGHLG